MRPRRLPGQRCPPQIPVDACSPRPIPRVECLSGTAVMSSSAGPAAETERKQSVCIFLEHRPDATLPAAIEFLQELLGRRNATHDIILNRMQIAALVVAGGIQSPPPREPLACKRKRRLRNFKRAVPGDRGGESELGHVITKLLPLLGGPILDQVPGRLERVVVVEQPGPVRR